MSKTVGYPKIAAYFRQQIQDGTLKPGDTLPSFKETGAQFGVAHTTVNRAFRLLKEEGLTVAKPGVGTVVATSASPPGKSATGGAVPCKETLMSKQETRIRAIMLADEAETLANNGEYRGAMAYAAVAQAYAAIVSTWGGDEPEAAGCCALPDCQHRMEP